MSVEQTLSLPSKPEPSNSALEQAPQAHLVRNRRSSAELPPGALVPRLPRNAADITLDDPADYARLDRYTQAEDCLRAQRGRLLQRNSCRNPWIHRLDARLAKAVPLGRGQSVEVTADLFNLLNFIDHDWGQVRQTAEESGGVGIGSRVSLVELVGYDVAKGRGIYHVLEPRRHEIQVDRSRWRMQLSARYTF